MAAILQSSPNFRIKIPSRNLIFSPRISRVRNPISSSYTTRKATPSKTLQCKAGVVKNPVIKISKYTNPKKNLQLQNPHNFGFATLNPTKAAAAVASVAAVLATRQLAEKLISWVLAASNPGVQALAASRGSVLMSTGALFLAYKVATPMTVVAAAVQKWLDLYSTMLTVRIMLSWFPNIPWDRQPFMFMRELSDPYLSVFQCIIPPVKNILDVSPLLAFAVLGFFRACLDRALYVTL